jgi:flagellar biosynthesis anti-sigma factor FlgM
MRIEDNNNLTAALGQTAGTTPANPGASSNKAGGASSSTSAADGLELSKFAGSLSQVMQNDSANRSQRVAQLTAAVRSGTYQVDPQAVSRAMVDHIVGISQNAQ